MDRRDFLRRTAPLAVVGAAGCTGNTTPEDSPTPSPTATATDAPTTSPTATDAASETATATDSPTPTMEPTATPEVDQRVVVGPDGEFRFAPESFTVAAGDTVRWTWASAGHNVSPADGGQPTGANWAGKDETTYDEGTTYVHTFETPGDYQYHCDPHQGLGMRGSFTVE